MIINLLCVEKYLVNVFLIKYHNIRNILYGHKELSGSSTINLFGALQKQIFWKVMMKLLPSIDMDETLQGR